ncbi:MAG: hypothetical protein ACKVU1_11310 [bacterium]
MTGRLRARRTPRLIALAPLFVASLACADEPAPTHDPIATLLPTRQAHLIVDAPAGARVTAGDEVDTILPAAPFELPAGVHEVKISLPGYYTRKETLRIAERETRTLIAPLKPKTRRAAVARALVHPGWSSHYMERRASTFAFLGAAAIAAGGAVFYDAKMQDRVDEFEAVDARYASAVSASEVAALAIARDAAYEEIRDAEDFRGICLMALAGTYAVGLAEAALRFPWSAENRRVEIGPRIEELSPGEIRVTFLSTSRR